MLKFRPIHQIIIIPIVTLILSSSMTLARWALPEEASVEFEFYNRTVTIFASGKSEEVIEQQVKIVNEMGRNEFGVQRLHYNGNIAHIEILEAKTIYQGKEYKIDKNSIEIKPLASDGSGFDQLYQVLVSFPQAVPGAQLYLKYKEITHKQPLPNYFSTGFYFGQEGLWHKSTVHIQSELPFQVMVNDPKKSLDIKQHKNDKHQTLDIALVKPIYVSGINEPSSSQIPDHFKTWVSISTVQKQEDLGKALAHNFDVVVNQSLPPCFETIRQAAEKVHDPIDQINLVTSLLSEKIRYMGDWRSIEGRFAPRNLQVIAETGFGDCKDFSVATAAILKTLGYQIQMALVMRDQGYLHPEKSLPSLLAINHIIVKVTHKDGKILWVDPTNTLSMANGIFPDIADRPTIILGEQHPAYEYLPGIDSNHAQFEINNVVTIKNGSVMHTEGQVAMRGEKALSLAGATLSNSPQAIAEAVIHNLCGEVTPISKTINLPNLNSRIVKDVSFDFSYEQENNLLLTNDGVGVFLDSAWVDAYLNTSDDQVGTIYVGYPTSIRRKLLIKDAHVNNLTNLSFDLKTPWVEARRECRITPDGVEVDEITVIKKSFISAEEVKSPAYKDFKNQLKKYCTKVAIIIKPKEK
ncbi:MAG TPA: DUF3857 domain-containing protein [Candidatus Nitrosotenuis sp.]|jgi:hypothetical protein|nr:DUF3857 domain-containing protein [Candidatus Nitrosotenuis sp.]